MTSKPVQGWGDCPGHQLQERKDGLFLTDQEWHDLGSICQFWLETYRYVDRRTALAARIIAAAHIDGLDDAGKLGS